MPPVVSMYSTFPENTQLRCGGMFITEGQGYLMLRAPFSSPELLNSRGFCSNASQQFQHAAPRLPESFSGLFGGEA